MLKREMQLTFVCQYLRTFCCSLQLAESLFNYSKVFFFAQQEMDESELAGNEIK